MKLLNQLIEKQMRFKTLYVYTHLYNKLLYVIKNTESTEEGHVSGVLLPK